MKRREKIYIVPTEYGFMYGAGILTSLMGGVVYNNNLAFLLCFFLVALFLIGMVHTHNNIKNIHLEKFNVFLSPSESVGHGVLWVKSANPEGHSQLQVTCKDTDDVFDIVIPEVYKNSLHPQYFDFKTSGWGKKKIKKIRLASRFPFGFFYAWKNFELPTNYVIYPKPSGNLGLEESILVGQDESRTHQLNGDDFSEHKKYEVGDSQKHIDWKAYARGRPLLTKRFNEGERQTFIIDYDQAKGNEERRVRQLSQWIHLCEQEKISYSLKVKELQVAANLGEKHKHTCLKLIAGLKVIQ